MSCKHWAHEIPPSFLLVTCCLLAPCSCQKDARGGPLAETGDYPYHVQLDEKYSLKWNFNSTHIQFQASVATVGYVGLGISDHGDMFPGDMVIAWMSGQTVHFHDRHAKGREMPIKDEHQDWNLLDFRLEGNQNTTFTVIRKLNTCDYKDLPIAGATNRVIYAYSHEVPESDDVIPYHGTETRGSKSVILLEPPSQESDASNLPDDVITHDFLNDNYTVPPKDTTYACLIMKLPPLQEKHHLIRVEPVIETGHERVVHHIILYACDISLQNVSSDQLNSPHECYYQQPEVFKRCVNTLAAWGIGGLGFDYPGHVGHSLGTPEDPVYFKLETHYDNVDMRGDIVDNSGLRLYLTTNLRQYDAGMLMIGAEVGWDPIIPPGIDNFPSRSYCPPLCLQKNDVDEINIFANVLHSHLIGKKMATRLVRDGQELPPILKDDHYDFNYQETKLLAEERVVKKGDMLITDCIYDSSKRTKTTFGGLSSREEMCLSFILYYPRTNIVHCYSGTTYTKLSKNIYTKEFFRNMDKTDWSVQKTREDFIKNVGESDVMLKCIYRDGDEKTNYALSPRNFKEYVPEDTCSDEANSKAVAAIASDWIICFACLIGSIALSKYN